MRSYDWVKELYCVGRIDLETYRSRLFELKGDLLESIKEIDELYANPPRPNEDHEINDQNKKN